MRRFFTKKRSFMALAAVAALAIAGAAFAYFTASGSGTGTASVDSASPWTVTTSTTGGPLAPGVATKDQTVTVNVKNAGTGNQAVNAFTIKVADSSGNAWTGPKTAFPSENGCSASDFALGTNAAAGSYTVDHSVDSSLPATLAPGATYTTTVNLHMLDTGVPQDNCQSLTNVPLYVSAS